MAKPPNRDTNEMSEKRKRNTYNAEFKAKVGLEAIHGIKTVNEIGQAYGVHPVHRTQQGGGALIVDKYGPATPPPGEPAAPGQRCSAASEAQAVA